jgi:hypothetical protein
VKWEYLHMHPNNGGVLFQDGNKITSDDRNYQTMFNVLGNEGWECIAWNDWFRSWVFKREIR